MDTNRDGKIQCVHPTLTAMLRTANPNPNRLLGTVSLSDGGCSSIKQEVLTSPPTPV